MNWSSFLSTSASAKPVFTSPAMRVGLKKVFSWRNITVSPPTVLTPSFMPILIGRMGGAEAAASFSRTSSET